ncbi:ribonuclease T2 family protein [Phreatobacter oligotrophus]|uniref:Ribonuclease T2 n=1 Tax=Phreatobacter oligotrophus TaxID=1122261 RepID=A0A2T4YXM9_9HYPH|nr:ribonuclease T2 [Phreatobacter oligotrophus]PTM50885.1 ribonuclease T2 [Phreatobacter oligotrophus]
MVGVRQVLRAVRGGWSAVLLAALLAAGLTAGLAAATPARAQAQPGAAPGSFDFFVLALSWSPSFCEANADRTERSMQCAGERPYAFVVHGLWPQRTRGFPEYCQVPPPYLDRSVINGMLDIMPAPGLVRHQWAKHGTCADARSPRSYFELVRQARAKIRIPQEFEALAEPKTVTPDEVEEAFIRANPGLGRDMVAVQCDQRRLREVRICIGRDMNFTACEEIDRRACRAQRLVMPPVRSGRS